MTASDIAAYFSRHTVEATEMFLWLAEHTHEIRTADGQRLNDATDFRAILVEIAEAMSPKLSVGPAVVPPQRRWSDTCNQCGHEHERPDECGKFMGPRAGYCQCSVRASA